MWETLEYSLSSSLLASLHLILTTPVMREVSSIGLIHAYLEMWWNPCVLSQIMLVLEICKIKNNEVVKWVIIIYIFWLIIDDIFWKNIFNTTNPSINFICIFFSTLIGMRFLAKFNLYINLKISFSFLGVEISNI